MDGKAAAIRLPLNATSRMPMVIGSPSQSQNPHEEPFDEQTHLAEPSAPGMPYHIETMDGRTFSGRTGPDGRLPRIETIGEDAYTILWGDAALAKGTAE